jgi:hypothetical protein
MRLQDPIRGFRVRIQGFRIRILGLTVRLSEFGIVILGRSDHLRDHRLHQLDTNIRLFRKTICVLSESFRFSR